MRDGRMKQIEALVARRETVSMEELRRTFGVSIKLPKISHLKLTGRRRNATITM